MWGGGGVFVAEITKIYKGNGMDGVGGDPHSSIPFQSTPVSPSQLFQKSYIYFCPLLQIYLISSTNRGSTNGDTRNLCVSNRTVYLPVYV